MSYTITVTDSFSAAHALRNYNGKCENLHGHNWKVKVSVLGSKLDRSGMILDFSELKNLLKGVLAELDHKFLNESEPFDNINPTAENIAEHIFGMLEKRVGKKINISEVEVWESEGSSAIFRLHNV